MIGFVLLLLVLLVGVGYFLYKNQQDECELQELLRETRAEDEEHDRTRIS
jgi:hypothetical protein